MFSYKKEKEQLKSLRGILKAKGKCAGKKVNFPLKKNDIQNLIELNNIMYAAGAYVSHLVGAKNFQRQKRDLGGRDG